MILRMSIVIMFLLCPILQLVVSFGYHNCPAIQRQWNSYVGNRVIANRRFDENVCNISRGGNSCCTSEMLMGMSEASEHEIRRILKNLLITNAGNFHNDTLALKTFVMDTLGTTMEQLHTQLRRDFAYKFRPHEQFFINFFTTIQSYIFGNADHLPRLVTVFFDELLVRVTQILLSTNTTDAHSQCVVDALRSKQPFLQIPSIIINMTMEAFPPIRTAVNAMAFARETLLAASITVHPPHDCFAEYHRIRFCSLCAGITTAKACESSCNRLGVICTSQHLKLGPVWKAFVNALKEIMDFLDKFPKVHRPLQMHLTDAIMNLKSVYTMHEHEIMSNCSAVSPDSGGIPISDPVIGSNPAGQWPYGGNIRRSRRQLPSSSFYRLPPNAYQQKQQPPSSSDFRPAHLFETRPLPAVSLTEQGIAALKSWVSETKQRYDKVANLFDSLGSEMCFSETIHPIFGSNRVIQSTSCWNGTALVPSSSMKSDERQGYPASPTDPTLHQKDIGLKKAVNILQYVARSMMSDPEVLPLMDPDATVLKAGKNEVPVHSDEEALRSYLSAPVSSGWSGKPSVVGSMPQEPPAIPTGGLDGGFGLDTEVGDGVEVGSGYPGDGNLSAPYGGPFPQQPFGSESDINSNSHFFDVPPVPTHAPLSTHETLSPIRPVPGSFDRIRVEDDEDFQQRVENSGYEPEDIYGLNNPLQSEVTSPTWPDQPHQPFDPSQHGLRPNSWDTEPDTPEEGSGSELSSVDHGAGAWYEKPWTGSPQPVQPIKPPTAVRRPSITSGGSDSIGTGSVVDEVGKLDIPDQIWVPESGGVEHHYPGPFNPRVITTSGTKLFIPPLFLHIVIIFLLRR